MQTEETVVDQEETVTRNKVPLYISAVIIAAVVISYFVIPGVQHFLNKAFTVLTSGNDQRINQWVSQFGFWGPLMIIIAMTVQMFLIVIPSPILIGVAVLGYGAFWGSVIAVLAIVTASTVGYIIGAYLGPPFVAKLLGGSNKQKVEKAVDQYGFWAVVVIRLNPFLSDDAISFVGGILRMGYWKFIAATVLGVIPLTLFIAFLEAYTRQIQDIFLWVGIVSLVMFAIYVWWDKKLK